MTHGNRPDGPTIGLIEWFRPGDFDQVERVLEDLKALGVDDLRTGFSWADHHSAEGEAWYDWLIPRLAREVRVLPCFHYTPPSLGIIPTAASPPRDPKAYADFLDVVITRLGRHFEWVELWNEPNNLGDWDWRLDPDWMIFCTMIGGAAYWARQRGKKTVLGGLCPTDTNWLRRAGERGVLAQFDAIGIHGFPGTWEYDREEWDASTDRVRQVLERYNPEAEVWITEAGFSTWRHDELGQIRAFTRATEARADRLYWYSAYDLHPDRPARDGHHADERHYHMGIKRHEGTPKLLSRLWEAGGPEEVRAIADLAHPAGARRGGGHALITGGAGFIGTNLAHRLLSEGRPVVLLDNLARPGVEANYRWLREAHGDLVSLELADVRDRFAIRRALRGASQVFHLAAQVAVTTSLVDPVQDFEVNARGTLNLLEELRALADPPPLVFTSTNKVYGDLGDLALTSDDARYDFADARLRGHGIGEDRPLCFHSPYGCSKGAADQYVLDYARSFGLPAVVFRMSCVYGPHQRGTEDQGWVAHFLIRAMEGRPITLYGDGRQVRDVLFVEDLVDAILLAQAEIRALSGRAFNIGGGPANTTSLLELVDLIAELRGGRPSLRFEGWRTGDQRSYVSDARRFGRATGWAPRIGLEDGIEALHRWLIDLRRPARGARTAREVIA